MRTRSACARSASASWRATPRTTSTSTGTTTTRTLTCAPPQTALPARARQPGPSARRAAPADRRPRRSGAGLGVGRRGDVEEAQDEAPQHTDAGREAAGRQPEQELHRGPPQPPGPSPPAREPGAPRARPLTAAPSVAARSCSRSWSTTSTPSTCRTTCPPRRRHPAARPATFAWCVARLAPTPTRWTAPGATAGLAAAGPPVPGASGRCLPAQALLQVLGGPQVLRDLHGNQRCALADRLGAAFLLDRASRLWGSAVRLRAMMRRYATAARVTLYTAESSESLAQNVS